MKALLNNSLVQKITRSFGILTSISTALFLFANSAMAQATGNGTISISEAEAAAATSGPGSFGFAILMLVMWTCLIFGVVLTFAAVLEFINKHDWGVLRNKLAGYALMFAISGSIYWFKGQERTSVENSQMNTVAQAYGN